MLDTLLNWIQKRGGSRMILRDGKPYLERFYLFKTRWLTVMIHKFWNDDPDECHDHPWDWASYVLRGFIQEHGVDGIIHDRGPGSFRFRRGEEFHRLTVLDSDRKFFGTPVTLFFTGRRKREWGFLRGEKWQPASTYDRQEVEIQGRDFTVDGMFFPKVNKINRIKEKRNGRRKQQSVGSKSKGNNAGGRRKIPRRDGGGAD